MNTDKGGPMNHVAGAVVVFFLCLVAFTKLIGPVPLSISSVTTQKTDTFSVTGTGKATAIPNIAVTSVGVTVSGATVNTVQGELNKKINAITAAIKQQGIEDKYIQTSNYSIYPTYDYTRSTQTITGYQASSTLTIRIKQLDKINAVIDQATKNGANTVSGVSFDVEDSSTVESQARDLAIADAKKKAEAAAKSAGFSLGRIINYSEGNIQAPRPVMMMDMAKSSGTPVSETSVQPGSNEVSISVTISYELR